MKTILIIMTLYCLPYMGFSQEEKAEHKFNSLQLNWGMANLKIQNISASPFIHNAWSPLNAMLRYNRSKKFEHQGSIKFSLLKDMIAEPYEYSAIFTDDEFVSTLPHEFLFIEINYSFGKQVLQLSDLKLTVGGRSSNFLNQSFYDLGPAGSGVYYFSFGLDMWLNAKYDLSDKHHFAANLALPTFSYVTRSPYMTVDGPFISDNQTHKGGDAFINYLKRGEIQSWNKRQAVNFDFSYYYTLSEKWDIGLTYLLAMNFNNEPRRYTAIENIIQFSGKLNF